MTETSNPKWEQELREALVNAVAPPPLAEARHEQILREALADPLAPATAAELEAAEALRQALDGEAESTDAALARALRHAIGPTPAPSERAAVERAIEQALPRRRGNVVFVAFGIAASALAVAAAIALVLGPLARAPEAVSQRELVPSRSFAPLLDAESARLPASARLDRMVAARQRDLSLQPLLGVGSALMRRWLAVGLLLAIGACSRGRDESLCVQADAGRPVDPALMAFLSRARAAHHVADQAEASADLERASKVLADVVQGPLPGSATDLAPEVREVLADTLARQADLLSQRGDDERASALVERGLGLVPTPTYFRGHLFEVRGLLEERRAARLKERGDLDGAAAARARALDALDTAMKIQAEVIEREKPSQR